MTPRWLDFAAVEVEEVSCPLCGCGEGKLLSMQLDRFGVVRCRRCGLVRLSPRPTAAAARKLYAEDYYLYGGYDDYVRTFETYRALFEKYFATRLGLVRRHVRGPGRLLECGCAHGFQLDWLRRQGWEVAGNEVSPHAAAYARDRLGLSVLEGPLETAPLPAAAFDVIYMVDILEHLSDPRPALANVRRALSPGGVLLVQCPYELYHWEKIAQALWQGKKPGTIAPDAVPYHLLFFVPRTLRMMLETSGFIIRARYSGNYGGIRRYITPPRIRAATPWETAARYIYFRLGVQQLARGAARLFKQGSGIIYVAAAGANGDA